MSGVTILDPPTGRRTAASKDRSRSQNPILGLIYERTQFQATTPVLGIPTLTYPTNNGAFIEGNDDFVLSTFTIEWDFSMGGVWSDVMRVVVAC